jgi:hypothetical protein
MKKPDSKSSNLVDALTPLAGKDATLARMLKMNRPLTMETYLRMEYPQGVPKLTAEVLAGVPAPLRVAAPSVETETDGIKAEALRRSQARQLSKARLAPTSASSK